MPGKNEKAEKAALSIGRRETTPWTSVFVLTLCKIFYRSCHSFQVFAVETSEWDEIVMQCLLVVYHDLITPLCVDFYFHTFSPDISQYNTRKHCITALYHAEYSAGNNWEFWYMRQL